MLYKGVCIYLIKTLAPYVVNVFLCTTNLLLWWNTWFILGEMTWIHSFKIYLYLNHSDLSGHLYECGTYTYTHLHTYTINKQTINILSAHKLRNISGKLGFRMLQLDITGTHTTTQTTEVNTSLLRLPREGSFLFVIEDWGLHQFPIVLLKTFWRALCVKFELILNERNKQWLTFLSGLALWK